MAIISPPAEIKKGKKSAGRFIPVFHSIIANSSPPEKIPCLAGGFFDILVIITGYRESDKEFCHEFGVFGF
jgi:hypothetical protein